MHAGDDQDFIFHSPFFVSFVCFVVLCLIRVHSYLFAANHPTFLSVPPRLRGEPEIVNRKLLAYLQLLRLPNVFTAIADVAMGFLVTRLAFPTDDSSPSTVGTFILLVFTSVCLYLSGMVLNDLFDVEIDRRERPTRPLPSGRVSISTAARLGYGLLVVGFASGWAVAYFVNDLRPGIFTSLLSITVFAYNRIVKHTPAGPVAMGACRVLNVLLGMSTSIDPWGDWNWIVAAGIGLYIVGVTWFARSEATDGRRFELILGTILIAAGMLLLAISLHAMPAVEVVTLLQQQPMRWYLLWFVLGVIIARRCIVAIVDPRPQLVQQAVRQCIFSLIMLDAVICYAMRDVYGAVAILLLFPPMLILGRVVYST